MVMGPHHLVNGQGHEARISSWSWDCAVPDTLTFKTTGSGFNTHPLPPASDVLIQQVQNFAAQGVVRSRQPGIVCTAADGTCTSAVIKLYGIPLSP